MNLEPDTWEDYAPGEDGDSDGWHDSDGHPLFTDLAVVLADGYRPPKPTVMRRDDRIGLFYADAVNVLFGESESGKTWIALAAIAEVLTDGGRALFVDLDHNGAQAIGARLLAFGVPFATVVDRTRFRVSEPDEWQDLQAVISIAVSTFRPALVVVDSVGEVVPLRGGNSNSPDDYTAVHRAVFTRLASAGAAVVAIDHEPKNRETAKLGATGTAAKRRAVNGAYLRVKKDARRPFAPGHGGAAYISIAKDRFGGLRGASPTGTEEREPLAARFVMDADGDRLNWHLYAPGDNERNPDSAANEDHVRRLLEDPNVFAMTISGACSVLHIRREDAAKALAEAKRRKESELDAVPSSHTMGTEPEPQTAPLWEDGAA